MRGYTAARLTFAIAIITCLGLAAQPAAASPQASTIHLLSDFNGWDETLWTSDPGMTKVGSTWTDVVSISSFYVLQDFQQFKFVTDAAWDTPADYVLCPAQLHEYTTLSGPVCLESFGLNIQMYADVPGMYEFTLEESQLTFSAQLVEAFTAAIAGRIETAPPVVPLPVAEVRLFAPGTDLLLAWALSDPVTGQFLLPQLDGGAYDLRVHTPGYDDALLPSIAVGDGGTTDVGAITLTRGCNTQWSLIQIVGDFNGWDTSVGGMTEVSPCLWEQAVQVGQGCHFMKFRTNNAWGDDYGTCTAEDPNCTQPLSGNTCLVSGGNALGKLDFPATDLYLFRLDEALGTYEIVPLATPNRKSTWGSLKVKYR